MRKAISPSEVPTLVAERLQTWGAAIRKQRVGMHITAEDLCARLDISRPTLRRMEQGDAAVAAALYLAALHILGILPLAAPPLENRLWEMADSAPRAVSREHDDDYF